MADNDNDNASPAGPMTIVQLGMECGDSLLTSCRARGMPPNQIITVAASLVVHLVRTLSPPASAAEVLEHVIEYQRKLLVAAD